MSMLDIEVSGRESYQQVVFPKQIIITWTGLILKMKAVPIFLYLVSCYVEITFLLIFFAYKFPSLRG